MKNQENLNLLWKRQSIDANTTKMTKMLELSNKDFKATIIKMLQHTNKNIFEINRKIENDIKYIKRNQMVILMLENIIIKEKKKKTY